MATSKETVSVSGPRKRRERKKVQVAARISRLLKAQPKIQVASTIPLNRGFFTLERIRQGEVVKRRSRAKTKAVGR